MKASLKAQCELKHAKKRALERTGIFYSTVDLKAIASLIRTGQSEHLESQSIARTIHRVKFREREHVVVYSRRSKQIVTFLDGLYQPPKE